MNDIFDSIQSNLDSLARTRVKYEDLRVKVRPYAAQLEHCAEVHGGTVLVLSEAICITLPLKSFRDAMPLIECVELILSCDFNRTRDTDSYRCYTATDCPWIRIDGEVSTDDGTDPTLKCKRVLTGKFNTYPEYKLVCEE